MSFRLSQCVGGALLLSVLPACSDEDVAGSAREEVGGLALAFEDTAAPEVFQLRSEVEIGGESEDAGLWAAVRGLERPERALVQSLETGRTVVVPLFRTGTEPRISVATARALGVLGARKTPLQITAIRSEVRLAVPPTRF